MVDLVGCWKCDVNGVINDNVDLWSDYDCWGELFEECGVSENED